MSGWLAWIHAWLADLGLVHFMRPHWLWALLALPLPWLIWRWKQRRDDVWAAWVDPHLLPVLRSGATPSRRRYWGWLVPTLAWALGVVALAGPGWTRQSQPLWRDASPLVIALDLSSASTASDLPPSRLLQARSKIAALLRERGSGQVALLAWAGDAFTVAPLTDDGANVAVFLDALEPDVMPADGQRADRAIELAQRLLKQAGFARGRILLLTDHADAAADAAAAQARAQGYATSVLGLGTAEGAAYRDRQGGIARARLDAGSLRALAGSGGGRYAALTAGDADLQALGVLDPESDAASASRERGSLAWQDQGYWLLPALLLLALLAFRRGALAAIALAVLLPMATPARAADGNWWLRADQQRQQRIEQGVAAYRKGDYAQAQRDFNGIDTDQGWYNLGNALAKQGRYDEAIAAYDRALKAHPRMADAVANKAAVEAARKRQQQNGGKSGQDHQQKPGADGKQGKDGNPSSGQGPQNGQGKPPSAPPGQPPSPSDDAQPGRNQGRNGDAQAKSKAGQDKPKTENAQTQQQADAAQREKMRQALQRQQEQASGQTVDGKPPARETAQQREQRQAVEAWLRRVPDDPGGLLRARFQLEQQRREREGR